MSSNESRRYEYDFTVITASFNSVSTIEACISSVRSQEGVLVQHIIADGGSLDGTVEVLDKLRHEHLLVRVESDTGVYNAWNKAVLHAQGKWVLFLGSDDELANKSCLKEVLGFAGNSGTAPGLMFGRVRKETPDGDLISIRGEPYCKTSPGWDLPMVQLPPHPACFFRADVFTSLPLFDESFELCADSLHLGLVIRRHEPQYLDILITKFRTGGLTNNRRFAIKKWLEKKRVSRCLGYNIPRFLLIVSFLKALTSQLRAL